MLALVRFCRHILASAVNIAQVDKGIIAEAFRKYIRMQIEICCYATDEVPSVRRVYFLKRSTIYTKTHYQSKKDSLYDRNHK